MATEDVSVRLVVPGPAPEHPEPSPLPVETVAPPVSPGPDAPQPVDPAPAEPAQPAPPIAPPPSPTSTSTPSPLPPPDLATVVPHLPRTGVELLAALLIAVLLLALGVLLVRAGRVTRRPVSADPRRS